MAMHYILLYNMCLTSNGKHPTAHASLNIHIIVLSLSLPLASILLSRLPQTPGPAQAYDFLDCHVGVRHPSLVHGWLWSAVS